jgi:hypothetical protein
MREKVWERGLQVKQLFENQTAHERSWGLRKAKWSYLYSTALFKDVAYNSDYTA